MDTYSLICRQLENSDLTGVALADSIEAVARRDRLALTEQQYTDLMEWAYGERAKANGRWLTW